MLLIPPNNIWGPHFWYVIHLVAFSYPDKPNDLHKLSYKNFFESFANVLPCQNCRDHYKTHLSKHPITPYLDNSILLNKWVIELHNRVNQSLNKPTMSYESVLRLYTNFHPTSPFNKFKQIAEQFEQQKIDNTKIYKYIGLIGIFILIIITIIYLQKKYYYEY